MYYLMIGVAAFLFSLQFVFNDGYRKECGNTWSASLKFSLYTSCTGLVALLIINGFHIDVSLFSTIVAFVYSLVCIVLGYSSIRAFEYANLSVYSIFAMIGGMILPFLYGIICGEEIKLIRIICCVLIGVSVILSADKGDKSGKAVKYYITVFVLNGMVGVISAFHQSYSELCVDSGSFMMLTKVVTAVMSLILMFFQEKRSLLISKKGFMYSAFYSVWNSIGNLLLLIALLHLPASVQYPMVTGGTILFSTLIVIVRKEKISKKEIVAAVIAFGATALMEN